MLVNQLSNGLKMIKHQIDIVSVTSKSCPLHGNANNEQKMDDETLCARGLPVGSVALSLSCDGTVKTDETHFICGLDEVTDMPSTTFNI